MIRVEGWEGRLAKVIAGALDRPYQLGRHDCFTFACECCEAICGEHPGGQIIGAYDTRRSSLRLVRMLSEEGGRGAIEKLVGKPSRPPQMAQRGDWLLYIDDVGVEHLGVCIGAVAAVLGETGLNHIGLRDCVCSWPIGW